MAGLPPRIKFAGTHLYTWVERGTVRVKCLAQEHDTWLEPGPLTPESSALAMSRRASHVLTIQSFFLPHMQSQNTSALVILPAYSTLNVKHEIFNMTRAWNKEKSESPTRIEPMTSRTPGGRSILGSALPNSSWVVIESLLMMNSAVLILAVCRTLVTY